MTDIEKLLDVLGVCLKEDTSKNTRELSISNKYQIHQDILDSFSIEHHIEGDYFKIKLENKDIKIFKNLSDALKHTKIISDSVNYIILNTHIPQNCLLRNIQYFLRLKSILIDNQIIDFDDEINKIFFLLSSTYGKVAIGYHSDANRINYYSTTHELDFGKLEHLLDTDNFPSFFKDAIARLLSDKPKKDLYAILTNFNFLILNAENALSLYQHNFSFEEFEKKFNKDLSDYVEKLQELTSSFHSKVMAIPLQFGVYIYLLSKFQSEALSLYFVILTIVVWSTFNYFVTSKTYSNVSSLEIEIQNKINLIQLDSGVVEKKLSKHKQYLTKNIGNMKNIIVVYQAFNVALTLLLIILFVSFK
ncbi:hypothetical protein [Psychrobacter sp. LV10R520-6]|uniref:hypothetical protein n=1 Tax=Psychrobacter sp. LV10R520-6 TaxID=1415574 RepID=UPI0024CBFD21|nr:hypothetical protein [Psychrobacter sp. LV10R520-6]SNT69074.1 hypothetical protein SAMN04488491_0127 [Psychrobacter sp. LV10R520-6]